MSLEPELPLHRDAAAFVSVLERVLLDLRELSATTDRAPVATALRGAIAAIDRAAELDVEHAAYFEVVDEVLLRLAESAESLRPFAQEPAGRRAIEELAAVTAAVRRGREVALELLVARQDRLLRGSAPTRDAPAPPPFRASLGTPALHWVAHASVELEVDLSTPAEEPSDDGSARARSLAPPEPATQRSADHYAALARDCLTDLASLGSLRRPLPEQIWSDSARFEDRLLASLDALLCLGREAPSPGGAEGASYDVLGDVRRFHREASFPDPGRAFALAFTLACVDAEATARVATLALRQAPPETHAAFGDAFALGSSRHIGPALGRLLGDAEPALAALVLDTLRRRREATFAVSATYLGHPDERVAAAAARCLSVVEPRAPAARLLRRSLEHPPGDTLATAAAESLLALGDHAGLAFVRQRLEERGSELAEADRLAYVRLLSLAGNARDLDLLARSLGQAPADATAAGWFGHKDLCPWLMASLAAANEVREATGPVRLAFEQAAADALFRIAGAPLGDRPDLGLERQAGSPAIEAGAWHAFWEAAEPRFERDRKYRFGRPYAPELTLDELAGPSLPGVRADAALELAVVTGGALALDTTDWVARQRTALAEARARAPRLGWAAGSFPAPRELLRIRSASSRARELSPSSASRVSASSHSRSCSSHARLLRPASCSTRSLARGLDQMARLMAA
ncbi:MAG: hypothetical protein IT373_06410 [Polyangiaceae bacterium]|nr:hypothetical protein [Polyangiaceae bacterium]